MEVYRPLKLRRPLIAKSTNFDLGIFSLSAQLFSLKRWPSRTSSSTWSRGRSFLGFPWSLCHCRGSFLQQLVSFLSRWWADLEIKAIDWEESLFWSLAAAVASSLDPAACLLDVSSNGWVYTATRIGFPTYQRGIGPVRTKMLNLT